MLQPQLASSAPHASVMHHCQVLNPPPPPNLVIEDVTKSTMPRCALSLSLSASRRHFQYLPVARACKLTVAATTNSTKQKKEENKNMSVSKKNEWHSLGAREKKKVMARQMEHPIKLAIASDSAMPMKTSHLKSNPGAVVTLEGHEFWLAGFSFSSARFPRSRRHEKACGFAGREWGNW